MIFRRSTVGRRQLIRALQCTTATIIASNIGTSRGAVSYWACGSRIPSAPNRHKLADLLAIAESAWAMPMSTGTQLAPR